MDTLKFIGDRYKVDLNQDMIKLPIGRRRDLPKLFRDLGLNKGAEIGVCHGSYSNDLLRYNPKLHLLGIDSWVVYPGYKDFQATDIAQARIDAYEIFAKYPDRSFIMEGWSLDAAKLVPDESLDFVFIDANHDYPHVVEDLAIWSKKVRKGGIVSGHDYDDYTNKGRWKEMHVQSALDGWVKSFKIKPVFLTSNNFVTTWFYVK